MKLWLTEFVDSMDGEQIAFVKAGIDAEDAEKAGYNCLITSGEDIELWSSKNPPTELSSVTDARDDVYDVQLKRVKKGGDER